MGPLGAVPTAGVNLAPSSLAPPAPDPLAVTRFVQAQMGAGGAPLSRGTQSRVYLYQDQSGRYVIKTPRDGLVGACIGRWMMLREWHIYQRLEGLAGVPRCHGLIDGRYLLLDFVDGETFRSAQHRLTADDPFFDRLGRLITALHARGVAHTDLKRKDNLLVLADGTPCLIDFGAAMQRRQGPLSRTLFLMGRQFDRNAWIKLKYNGYRGVSPDDLHHLRRLPIERVSHWIKRRLRHLRRAAMKHRGSDQP